MFYSKEDQKIWEIVEGFGAKKLYDNPCQTLSTSLSTMEQRLHKSHVTATNPWGFKSRDCRTWPRAFSLTNPIRSCLLSPSDIGQHWDTSALLGSQDKRGTFLGRRHFELTMLWTHVWRELWGWERKTGLLRQQTLTLTSLGKSLALVQKMASSGYHADGNQI